MRLKKILIAGFKSFVDSTDIRLPGNLVGVVGPNGCGKSNVIDAVRWVMGETSAKLLRGDSMSDVIFNGSTSRKPISKASVELVFDNSAGKSPGKFARFSEISVKRILTRDGASDYLINNIKSRRKDVLDLFRGTGLGPRSYSVIEQGMVSRIVEAKPEEIRSFIEDAAGISKYKEKRRETENRIEHTRTNLERVDDIRQEISTQLSRLKRQSNQAQRFKDLKSEERDVEGQYNVLQLIQLENQLLSETRSSESKRNLLESEIAELRKVEAEVTKLQDFQTKSRDHYDSLQEEFYPLSAEIAEIEQKLDFLEQNKTTNISETKQIEMEQIERSELITEVDQHRKQIEKDRSELQPIMEYKQSQLDKIQSEYAKADQDLRDWATKVHEFNEKQYAPRQEVQVHQSRIDYLEYRINELNNEQNSIEKAIDETNNQLGDDELTILKEKLSDHEKIHQECESELHQSEAELNRIIQEIELKRDELTLHTNQSHELNSRVKSLEEIQAAYFAEDDQAIQSWLDSMKIRDRKKLFEILSIEDGWEPAVDRILGSLLSAIYVDTVTNESLQDRPDANLSLILGAPKNEIKKKVQPDNLLEHINHGKELLQDLLVGVRTATSIEDALTRIEDLKDREVFVTRDGALVGANWISFSKSDSQKTGMLVRREELSQLHTKTKRIDEQIHNVRLQIEELQVRRQIQDETTIEHRTKLAELRSSSSKLHGQIGREETAWQELLNRIQSLQDRKQSLNEKVKVTQEELKQAQELLAKSQHNVEDMRKQQQEFLEKNQSLDEIATRKLSELNLAREEFHETQLKSQQLQSELGRADERLERLKKDHEGALDRLDELTFAEATRKTRAEQLKGSLEELLERKSISGSKLADAKNQISEIDQNVYTALNLQKEMNTRVEHCREALTQQDMKKQEARVLHDQHIQVMQENDFSIELIKSKLDEEVNLDECESKLEKLRTKIEKIGPVNLVAIQEFEELSERESYLVSQHADLTEALSTLESVIKKIDRESRTRFKETFDKINAGFNRFFPELFGGGKAELFLITDDLLTAGITVMARPPGKRNSHIHLLSGGEKALTAVALLFALFELNPAPFCMLDEVDAPLDDANVSRYCETLKRLANNSQLIVVTHNKITMESMDRLLGVTMEESGVSRIVSVDVGQAVEMAVS
ncbi:MAG: chromosome segregation protein SMC [Gammaproteobacteria bacterium]|nr:chromosome segregation protein SMC [Gammaproteobacteria bacterium]MCY4218698.1 chromosome segregation protein SMC [Gammaproteobacteria bacterium]